MALNKTEIDKVNNLYKENDTLKEENARLRLIIERLDKMEAGMNEKLDKLLNESHSHD